MSAQNAPRFFEFQDSKSHKFWEAELQGTEVNYRYGNWRSHQSSGTRKTKAFETEALALKDFEKSCKAKQKAGYEVCDPSFPNSLKAEIEQAEKQGKTEFSVYSANPEVWKAVCKLTQLTKLSAFAGDDLKTLPEEVCDLPDLKYLMVDGNGLESLPENIGKLKNLQNLYAYHNKITHLPESIGECKNLRKISIWSNELSSVTESIGGLENLEELDLKYNKLRHLPEAIGKLQKLTELKVGDNKLVELPAALAQCGALKTLGLADNELTSLPENIGEYPALERLSFGENPIEGLPESLGQLVSLVQLEFSGGYEAQPLRSLPDSMQGMPNLTTVKLHYCQFTEVPEVLRHLPALETLELDECERITGIPEDILDDKDAIFKHLGWTQEAAPVEGARLTVPEDKERALLVKGRDDALKSFRREARYSREAITEEVITFISGKSDEMPQVRTEDARHMEDLEVVFAPYEQWCFIDERALALCATRFRYKTGTYYSGFYEALCRWLKKEVKRCPPQSMFAEIAQRLRGYGLTDLDILAAVLDDARDTLFIDGELTTVGEYFAEQSKSLNEEIMDLAFEEHAVSPITNIYLRRGDITPFLPRLLANKTYDDKIHPPLAVIEALVAYDAEKYEYTVHDGLRTGSKDCMVCINALGKILFEHYPDKHRTVSFDLSASGLELASKRRNSSDSGFFRVTSSLYYDKISEHFEWVFKSYGKDAKPLVFKFLEDTKVLDLAVVEVAAKHLGQDGLPLIAEALEMQLGKNLGRHYRRVFAMLKPLNYSAHYKRIWELASCEHDDIQNAACQALAWRKQDTLTEALERLSSPEALVRLGAAKLLRNLTPQDSQAALEKALVAESNDDIRDMIVDAVYRTPMRISLGEAQERIETANRRGKLKKWPKKWIETLDLPLPKFNDGAELTPEQTRYLVYRQVRSDSYELDPELRDVLDLLDKDSSSVFAATLLQGAFENGGLAAKNRPVLSLIGRLGGDDIIAELEAAASKPNENAVRMLGLMTSTQAAAALERIRRLFQIKYPNIREATEEAFSSIAERRDLSDNELRDLVIPDLGFVHGAQAIDVDGQEYEVQLNQLMKLQYVSPAGKVTKSVPKAAAKLVKDELKALSKALTELTKEYRPVIDEWLVTERSWAADAWSDLFMHNAFLFAASQGLVWGLFHDSELVAPFSVNADKTLETQDGEKVSMLGPHWVGDFQSMLGMVVPKPFSERKRDIDIQIGLLHPVNIDEAVRTAWVSKLAGRKVTPIIAQLTREIIRPSEEQAPRGLLYEFEGKEVPGATFKARSARFGWRRGSVNDGGGISGYYKYYPKDGLDAFITLSNLGVSGDLGEDAELGRLFFVPHGSVVTGSYIYDEPNNEADERLIVARDVPTVVFSETLSNLRQILGED